MARPRINYEVTTGDYVLFIQAYISYLNAKFV